MRKITNRWPQDEMMIESRSDVRRQQSEQKVCSKVMRHPEQIVVKIDSVPQKQHRRRRSGTAKHHHSDAAGNQRMTM